jgi:AraC-like DNA-binding protein
MGYSEFQPHPALRSYIDAYWVVKGDDNRTDTYRIFPDGCIDIIINPGDDFSTDSGKFTMKSESAYLVGTMTRYKDTVRQPGSLLIGIRFKPLGFPTFFKYHSLHEIKDQTVDFDKRLIPEIHADDGDIFLKLDKFFLNRLGVHPQRLNLLMNDMKGKNGNISIDALAKQHSLTSRQLERNFRHYLGISPKEYANFLRYQYASQLILNNPGKKTLLDIALNAGYYDHAHLTNEIRKYSGLSPSQL